MARPFLGAKDRTDRDGAQRSPKSRRADEARDSSRIWQALLESEDRYRETFDCAPVGIMHTDANSGRILRANPKLAEMLGYSASELLRMLIDDIEQHPADGDADLQGLLTGERDACSSELQYRRRDASVIWVRRTVSLARDPAGRPLHFIRIVEDVTARLLAEGALQRLNRARLVMAACGRALAYAADESALLQEMCRVAVEVGGYKIAWIGLPTGDPVRPVRAAAHAGYNGDEPMTGIAVRNGPHQYWGFMHDVIATGRAHIARNILQDPTLSRRRERAMQHGFQSSIALPLVDKGGVLGGVAFYAREPDAFDAEEIALLGEMAEDIAYGLTVLRTRIERECSEKRLRETERRALEIFDQVAVGITRTDLNGITVEANQKFCDMLGFSREEIIGRPIRDFTHPDDHGHGARYRSAVASGIDEGPLVSEKRFLRKDGSYVWGRRTLSAARDESGEVRYVVAVIEDITGRKEVEERYRSTFENVPVGIMYTSIEGDRLLQVNPRLCEMLGYAEEEILGMKSIDFIPAHLRGRERGKYRDRMLRGELKTYTSERQLLRRDGSTLWVSRTVSLARDAAGQPLHFIRVIEDITARKGLEQEWLATFDQAAVGISHTSLDGHYLRVNRKLCDITGYTQEELTRPDAPRMSHPEDIDSGGAQRRRLLSGEISSHSNEKRYIRKDGRSILVNRTESLARDALGRPMYFIRVVEDITDRKRTEAALRQSEEQFRQLAGNIPQVFWITDTSQKRSLYISQAAEIMLGRPLEEIRSDRRTLIRAVHPEDRERVYAARKSAVDRGYDETYRIVRPDASVRWIHDRAFPVRDADGRTYRIAGIAEDVTERKLAEERLEHLAHFDVLTGLPNRVLFHDRLRQAIAQARRNHWTIGVMFVDADRFKNVNDTMGHGVGDQLLQQIARRLRDAVRSDDTVGRLGGDEFAIVLTRLSQSQDANLVAQKIGAAFNEPFSLDGAEVYITVSIGITLFPDDSEELDVLVKNADTAMYRAKEAGRNSFQFYTPEMNVRAREFLSLESSLRRALEHHQFVLHYQPRADIRTGAISGMEALLRWQHPERGIVSPVEFIPVLEETGLIVPVGEWVIRTVCEQIRSWRDAGLPMVPVAINLAPRQFAARDLGTRIQRLLDEVGVDPRSVEFEITEGSLMTNVEDAQRTLGFLKSLGAGISVDDFGTGYSSLAYLKRFPLDALKIDRSFVRDVTTDADDATITRTVISMAHSLGLKVVAEGVETLEQLLFLASDGCDQIQGFYFARPMAADDCAKWLAEGRRLARSLG